SSAFYAEALEALVEAGELPAGIEQSVLSAGPSRMRFRVDVEPQGIPGFAVGRAGLVRGPVRHHDGNLMIIRVNALSHRTFLRNIRGYIGAATPMQSGRNRTNRQSSRPAPQRANFCGRFAPFGRIRCGGPNIFL